MARLLIYTGLGLVAGGLAVVLGGLYLRFGPLPGDIVLKRGNLTLYIPLAASAILSLLLSGLAWTVLWLLGRGVRS